MRHSTRRYVVLVGLCAALPLVACSKEDDLSGVFTGTVQFSASGVIATVPLRVTLTQSGSALTGTFEATSPNGTTSRGAVSGSVSGLAVSLAFAPTTAGDCPAQLSGTRNGIRIAGSVQITCPGQAPVPGTFELTKQ